MADTHFVNPIAEGADPAVVRDGDRYLWPQSDGDVAVAIWVSDRLTSLGTRHIVWRAPEDGPCSRQVWAPELVHLDDRWYIYFAASDGDNENHLAYVLASDSGDPLGSYTLHGPLATGESPDAEPIWAIDMTVLRHGDAAYAVWSGWPEPGVDQQGLYIARLTDPLTIGGGRVLICRAGEHDWERVEDTPASRGLAEGPQPLTRDGRTFLLYSCGASWLPSYKLGLLELVGSDPLDPACWRKSPEPVFQGTDATPGVGQGSFTTALNGREWWHFYHSKVDREPGWRRVLMAQPMWWGPDGLPEFGTAVAPGEPVPLPHATPSIDPSAGGQWDLTRTGQEGFDYYGHHQYLATADDGLHLGIVPAVPVNAFRSAEKIVLRDGDFRDVEASAEFTVLDGEHDVGLLFRVSRPAVGFDALRGYFAGLSVRRARVVLGAMDGRSWREIGSVSVTVDPAARQRLRVTAEGRSLRVWLGDGDEPVLAASDGDFGRGSVGCRVVDTHAVFHSLTVTPR